MIFWIDLGIDDFFSRVIKSFMLAYMFKQWAKKHLQECLSIQYEME